MTDRDEEIPASVVLAIRELIDWGKDVGILEDLTTTPLQAPTAGSRFDAALIVFASQWEDSHDEWYDEEGKPVEPWFEKGPVLLYEIALGKIASGEEGASSIAKNVLNEVRGDV